MNESGPRNEPLFPTLRVPASQEKKEKAFLDERYTFLFLRKLTDSTTTKKRAGSAGERRVIYAYTHTKAT